MSTRTASAEWNGTLKEGKGVMNLPDGQFEGPYTFVSRFESGEGTNPEELVGGAISGCFSMFLSALISKENITPTSIKTTASVTLETTDDGPAITSIHLETSADVPGISNEKLQELAQTAKEKCPISKLYSGTTISLTIELVN